MKAILTLIGFLALSLSQAAMADAMAGSAFLQGKVSGATGTLAQAGWTDCQVKVSSQTQTEIHLDFSLLNATTGTSMTVPNLTLTRQGRVGLYEKLAYDFGVRTAAQAINDPSIIPQAYSEFNNLIKVRNGGAVIQYDFSELRSNGEFYSATSSLSCIAD